MNNNSPFNSKPAELPAIVIPNSIDAGVRRALESIKERLEVREGSRGNPYERALTVRDLVDAGVDVVVTGRRVSPVKKGVEQKSAVFSNSSEESSDPNFKKLISLETNKLWEEIRRIERLPAPTGQVQAGGNLSITQTMATSGVNRYNRAQLENDLATGAATIIAAAASGTAVMDIGADGSYVLFRHRQANVAGLGAGYTGDFRTGLGITAAGLIAGYNRKTDGAWQNSIVIDSATGNVTILGTLKAGAVIETGVTVSGTSMADIRQGALNGTTSISALGSKLNRAAADTLNGVISVQTGGGFVAGNLNWNAAGVRTSGQGVAVTPQGILGHNGTINTFVISATTGQAIFGGELSAASGSFSGNVTTSGYVLAEGVTGFTSNSSTQFGTLVALNKSHAASAIVGRIEATATLAGGQDAAIDGRCFNGAALGVYAFSTGPISLRAVTLGGAGNRAISAEAVDGTAIYATATVSGLALEIGGRVKWGNQTFGSPPNNPASFLSSTGWGIIHLGAVSTGAATATFSGTNKPGSNSSSEWAQVNTSNGLRWIPCWV